MNFWIIGKHRYFYYHREQYIYIYNDITILVKIVLLKSFFLDH